MVTTPLPGATAPPVFVDANLPEPWPFGLFSVAKVLDATDPHVLNGVEFEPYVCTAALGFSRSCGATPSKSTTRDEGVAAYGSPYTLYQLFACGPFGYTLEQGQQVARQSLMLGEERGAEAELWAAGLGSQVSFQGATDLTPGGGPVSITAGIAALEKWLGTNYGGVGTLHMTRDAASDAVADFLIAKDPLAGALRTGLGTKVAAGGGYPGVSPAGVAPSATTTWLYASGDILIYRGEVFDTPDSPVATLNKVTDAVVAYAERTYVNTIDGCGVAAIHVNLAA